MSSLEALAPPSTRFFKEHELPVVGLPDLNTLLPFLNSLSFRQHLEALLQRGGRILELGGGENKAVAADIMDLSYASNLSAPFDYLNIDFNEPAQIVRGLLPPDHYQQILLSDPSQVMRVVPKGKFDLILNYGFINEVPDLPRVLQQLSNRLIEGGVFYSAYLPVFPEKWKERTKKLKQQGLMIADYISWSSPSELQRQGIAYAHYGMQKTDNSPPLIMAPSAFPLQRVIS